MKNYSHGLKETAYHEAGHLVADIIFKHNPHHASIIPDENFSGVVKSKTKIKNFNPYPHPEKKDEVEKVKEYRKMGLISVYDDTIKSRKTIRRLIISGLAGYEAELKFNPKIDSRCSNFDLERVFDLLEIGGYCVRMLEDNSIYYPVLSKLHNETKKFVEKYWSVIEEVAQFLLKNKELNEEDIEKLSQKILSAQK